jgi:hypothetical protein
VKKARLFADVDLNDPEAVEKVAKALEDEEKAVKKAKQTDQPLDDKVVKSEDLESEGESDDGEFITVDVPDGLTDEQAQQFVVQKFLADQTPAARRVK